MADWLDQTLWGLGSNPSLVTARHEKITQENGPYIANGCMRSPRAIYNYARKAARSLAERLDAGVRLGEHVAN